ncbi:MAG: DUF2127 domain-containing protein [Gemmatimonadaceae bacterium]|jgi:uncharacterized membrane protein (DUF2068 family)|nr:DUF2127 domain-containing protein [Gemmatimonadaceae bacterium]
MPPTARRVDRGVMAIAAFKLTGAVLLTLVGLGAFHLVQNDAVTVVQAWIARFGGDLDGATARALITRVAGIPEGRFELVGLGALGYALMLITQGIGLLRGKTWAEWLTVLVTASFIPLECYEIWRGATVFKVALLVVNSAIVVYLVWHLRKKARAVRALPA